MIELGNKVRDLVTGFEGIATARIEYINGCIQYCVKPKISEDGKMVDGEYLDEGQIEFVDKGVVMESTPSGGPQADCPKK